MVLIEALFEMVTEVGAPLLVNVAVPTPSGTVLGGTEFQLVPVVQSLVVAPVQVPLTAYAVPGPSIASAPMHTLPSSAARRDGVRGPGAAIRVAISPIETPDPGRSAECAVRKRNRCERIHPDPCNGTAGKTRPRATPPPPPRLVWGPTLRGEPRPINSGWGPWRRRWRPVAITPRQPQVVPQGRCYRIRAGERHPKSRGRVLT
jgi:hypothetical protein